MTKLYKAKDLFGPNGITRLSKGRFYALRKSGEFPPPNVILSERFHAWTSDVVEDWIESRRLDR